MNTMKLTLGLAVAVLLLSCTRQSTQTVNAINEEQVKAYLSECMEAYPLPGMVAVLVSGEQSMIMTFGKKDMSTGVPFADSTIFFGGEWSELMVSCAALELSYHQTLSLADRVVEHLPYFQMQGAYRQISIHHLLTHTSGISHFNPAWDMPTFEPSALEGTTRSIVFQPVEFEPGSRSRRSPYNIDIAADIIQKASGKTFETIMDRYLLNTVGMTASTFNFQSIDKSNLARPHHVGHWLTYSQQPSEIYPYTRENAGSYGFHTTARDMKRWMHAILSKDQIMLNVSKELLGRHYQTADNTFKGYGWDIFSTSEGHIYNNHWNAGGFSGDLTMAPDQQLGVLVLANTSEDFNPTVISNHLLAYMQGAKLPLVKKPVHIAMSHLLAEGRCMAEVLDWYEQQKRSGSNEYELNPALLGQVGINLLHRLSMREEALQVFEFAVRLYPEAPLAYLNLAEGLLVTGRPTEAKKAFDTAISLNLPPSPHVAFLQEKIAAELENQDNT